MTTAIASRRKPKACEYCYNSRTAEVFRRTPDNVWTHRMKAWIEAIDKKGGSRSCFRPVLPSPMPYGHIMFTGGGGSDYVCCDSPPELSWSDGARCLYKGQRVGWCVRETAWLSTWYFGSVVSVETLDGEAMLTVETLDGTETVPLSVLA